MLSIGRYEDVTVGGDKGQVARFAVNKPGKRSGAILQRIQITVVLDGESTERDYIEGWKVTSGGIVPDRGRDYFLVDKDFKQHNGE